MQVRQGLVILLLLLVDHAPLVVGPAEVGVQLDGLFAQLHGLGVVALGVVDGGFVGNEGRVVGLELQGLVKGLEGLVVTACLAVLDPLVDVRSGRPGRRSAPAAGAGRARPRVNMPFASLLVVLL